VLTPLVAGFIVAAAVVLSLFVGSDFFPEVDAGLIQLHVRAPARTRIERTDQIFHAIEENIRQQIPANDLGLVSWGIALVNCPP
jgi:multidrug efflux pump subunit AcrB